MISFKIPCLLRFQKLNVDAIGYCQFHFFFSEDVFKVCSFEFYNKNDLLSSTFCTHLLVLVVVF